MTVEQSIMPRLKNTVRRRAYGGPATARSKKRRGACTLFGIALGITIFGFSAVTEAQSPSQHRGNPVAGRELSLHDCDACHIVAHAQPVPPLAGGYGPPFLEIANRPNVTAQAIESYLTQLHPRSAMAYPQLTATQAADLASYIMSLRGQH